MRTSRAVITVGYPKSRCVFNTAVQTSLAEYANKTANLFYGLNTTQAIMHIPWIRISHLKVTCMGTECTRNVASGPMKLARTGIGATFATIVTPADVFQYLILLSPRCNLFCNWHNKVWCVNLPRCARQPAPHMGQVGAGGKVSHNIIIIQKILHCL